MQWIAFEGCWCVGLAGCIQVAQGVRVAACCQQKWPWHGGVRKASKLVAMPNLYEALIAMVRDHWKTHDNAYPQRIELSASDMQALLDERKLVNETMNFQLQPGWEQTFHGTPVQLADVSCMVDVNGQRLPVMLAGGTLPVKS